MSSPDIPATSVTTLYKGNHGWLHEWLRRRMNGSEDATDLMHDTFVRVLVKSDELPTLKEPRAYLTTIARGLLNDHWRRRSLERAWLEALASIPFDVAPGPDETVALFQSLQQLDALLADLAPKAREVFVLSQLEGLTYIQIADRTGLNERTIKRYMAQGFELCLTLME